MSKFNIYADEYDYLASDRLIENAEAMLALLREAHFLLTDPDAEPVHADRLTARLETMINHVETGAEL